MRKSSAAEISKKLGISKARSMEAIIKAQLIDAVLKSLAKNKMTHGELALKSGLSRSAVTGILSGSLQKVTIDRILRLVETLSLVAEVKVKAA